MLSTRAAAPRESTTTWSVRPAPARRRAARRTNGSTTGPKKPAATASCAGAPPRPRRRASPARPRARAATAPGTQYTLHAARLAATRPRRRATAPASCATSTGRPAATSTMPWSAVTMQRGVAAGSASTSRRPRGRPRSAPARHCHDSQPLTCPALSSVAPVASRRAHVVALGSAASGGVDPVVGRAGGRRTGRPAAPPRVSPDPSKNGAGPIRVDRDPGGRRLLEDGRLRLPAARVDRAGPTQLVDSPARSAHGAARSRPARARPAAGRCRARCHAGRPWCVGNPR